MNDVPTPKVFCAFDIVPVALPGAVKELQTNLPCEIPVGGFRWLHFNQSDGAMITDLTQVCDLDAMVAEQLFDPETRPRSTLFAEGLLVNLRGVNHNPGAQPEDLLALHIWLTGSLIISVAEGRLGAISELRERLRAGRGPRSTGDLLADLTQGLTDRLEPVISDLVDKIDVLEDDALEGKRADLRRRLVELRREAIVLRRYVAPQREALFRLSSDRMTDLLSDANRLSLREDGNQMTLYFEELDLARERAGLLSDLLYDLTSEKMNRDMLLLTVITAIFMPLTLLSGLLGMNVSGIPFHAHPLAFAAICVFAAVIAGLELWLFRRLKWI